MARKRHRFTADFKKRVALETLREHDTVQTIASRASRYEVHSNQVSAWKRQAVESLDGFFRVPGPSVMMTGNQRSGTCMPGLAN